MRKKTIYLVLCGASLIFFFYLGHVTEYLLSEFVYHRHCYANARSNCLEKENYPRNQETTDIPKHLHQIFFFETDKVLPSKFRRAQLSWQRHHPGYHYTMWNKTSIQDLIRRKYPQFEDLYNGYSHWVQRADMARYIVMHQYGGWYIDIDIQCKTGIQNLSSTAGHTNKNIVVRWTEPFGCSNDFIGVTPHHPFFLHVLFGLFQSNKWYMLPYFTTIFSTGPTFLWGRMLNYPYREEDVYWVYDHSQYFDLLHGSSWHGWDGKFVWHFFNHRGQLRRYLLAASYIIVVMMCVLLCRTRKRRLTRWKRLVMLSV